MGPVSLRVISGLNDYNAHEKLTSGVSLHLGDLLPEEKALLHILFLLPLLVVNEISPLL